MEPQQQMLPLEPVGETPLLPEEVVREATELMANLLIKLVKEPEGETHV